MCTAMYIYRCKIRFVLAMANLPFMVSSARFNSVGGDLGTWKSPPPPSDIGSHLYDPINYIRYYTKYWCTYYNDLVAKLGPLPSP